MRKYFFTIITAISLTSLNQNQSVKLNAHFKTIAIYKLYVPKLKINAMTTEPNSFWLLSLSNLESQNSELQKSYFLKCKKDTEISSVQITQSFIPILSNSKRWVSRYILKTKLTNLCLKFQKIWQFRCRQIPLQSARKTLTYQVTTLFYKQ